MDLVIVLCIETFGVVDFITEHHTIYFKSRYDHYNTAVVKWANSEGTESLDGMEPLTAQKLNNPFTGAAIKDFNINWQSYDNRIKE